MPNNPNILISLLSNKLGIINFIMNGDLTTRDLNNDEDMEKSNLVDRILETQSELEGMCIVLSEEII